MVEFFYVKI